MDFHLASGKHRLNGSRRSLCRVLDDGHDRDPVRLFPDDALSPGIYVAPSPGVIFDLPTCRILVLGSLTLVVPFIELRNPGQPAPYSSFPFVALTILVAAILIACVVVHRRPDTGSQEGAFSEAE